MEAELAELAELVDRFRKLDTFMATNPLFATQASVDQSLMVMQSVAMKSYADILRMRVNRALAGSARG